MSRFSLLLLFFPALLVSLHGQSPPPAGPDPLVQKIQAELEGPALPESSVNPAVPQGEYLHGVIHDPPMFPGTVSDFQVYIPAQYNPAKPACLLLKLDGLGAHEGTVLDNLIAARELPVIIGVGIAPGAVWKNPAGPRKGQPIRFDRSYEFDSMNGHFADFVLHYLLPAVQKMHTRDGRPIRLSPDGNDHAAMGASTGGIGSFTLAWQRPDQFTRVYDIIGTFVSMRGGHEYPALIRKTEPKPIRVFLEDGSIDAWNPLFGSWFDANQNMESALRFAGYDVAHAWGTHGHDGGPGARIFPDVMRWLWRDYPAPIKAGVSQNSTLRGILPAAGWQKLGREFHGATGLAANTTGDVYLADSSAVYRLGDDGNATAFLSHAPAIEDETFGPDGVLYGLVPGEKKIIAVDPSGTLRTVVGGIVGHSLLVTHDGTLYVSQSDDHNGSEIWRIRPSGEKKLMDRGLQSATAMAFSPDGGLFLAAEQDTKWIYSYIVQPDGTFADKQPFYWLHLAEFPPPDSGTQQIAVDSHGEIYVATPMGIQICDENGRVRAILPLPTPCGPARSLCFGGPRFDELYVTDGRQVFKRLLKVPGVPPWAAPQPYPSEGAG